MSRRRDVLSEVVLFPKPERPITSSRRVLSRWRQEVDLVGRANSCLLGVRQLYHGVFTNELLECGECWGRRPVPATLDGGGPPGEC